MLSKASSEIAQSRDTLRQRCRIVEAEVAATKRYTDGVEIIAKFAEEIERDTRERCGHLLQEAIDLTQAERDTRKLKAAANKLIDYCIAHDWGMMPEPYDSINPLLKLLGRFTERK